MSKLLGIDVTLRDGGNRIGFHFDETDLQNILPRLDRSGIEYIEVGYRNGAISVVDNVGVAGLCKNDYLQRCATLIKQASMAVMAHPQNITEEDIRALIEHKVKLLRLCVTKDNVEAFITVRKLCQQWDLQYSCNIIHISHYDRASLDALLQALQPEAQDIVYFADSNGSLSPSRVFDLYHHSMEKYNSSFGFHAHDNLGLAQANALAAMDAGVNYIDFSLSGMGKGIGNLRTEYFVAFLHSINMKQYDLASIVEAANYVRGRFNTETAALEMDEFTRGIYDLSTAQIKGARG